MERRKFDNSGIAFKNDRQRDGKRDADFTGSIMVEGKEYWLNIWKKTGTKGTYLTSTVRPKPSPGAMRDQRGYYNQVAPEDNQQPPQRAPQQRQQYQERPRNNFRDDMDDDIPF